MKRYKKDKLYFLGGSEGSDPNNNLISGGTNMGMGLATGNPMQIAQGGVDWIKGNVGNIKDVWNSDQSTFSKGLSTINPIYGAIAGNKARKAAMEEQQFKNDISSRNQSLGVDYLAKGGRLGFDKWYSKISQQLELDPNPDAPEQQYDYRGFYNKYGDVDMTKGQHFTDEFKLPGHPTFSNESKYSNKQTPGGSWNQMDNGDWIFEHSPFTMKHYNQTGKYLEGSGEYQALPAIEVRPKAMGGNLYPDGGLLPEEVSMMDYYNAQGMYTKALADKYPNIPINDILTQYANDPSFSLRNLDQYAKDLQGQYGDFYLTPEEINNLRKQGYPDIMGLSDDLKQYDMNQHQAFDTQSNGKYKYADTSGTNDTGDVMFGVRNMLQRSHPAGSSPYKYLDIKADGGKIDTRENIQNQPVIKEADPWYKQLPQNVAGWWQHNKPELFNTGIGSMLDPIAPIVDYLAGKGEEDSSMAILPTPIMNVKKGIQSLSREEYINKFNSKLDDLNNIIAKNNKSKPYKVVEMEDFPGWGENNVKIKFDTGNTAYTRVVPGKYSGDVSNITTQEELDFLQNSFPGISMDDIGSGVHGVDEYNKGTGLYKSLNEYLKNNELGRIKSGMGSQTEASAGLWEKYINDERATGLIYPDINNNVSRAYGMMKKNGGMVNINPSDDVLTEFNNGGSHENNIYSGVPQGMTPDGQVNKVEEGETKWQDYIFSDRLLLDKGLVASHNLPKNLTGKTFAEASKWINKSSKERPNDPISRDTKNSYMKTLTEVNDIARYTKELNDGVSDDIMQEFASGGSIHIKPENRGKFTSWAKSHGMGVQEAAKHVMANTDKYSPTIVKRANFAKNAASWHHENGGYVNTPMGVNPNQGTLYADGDLLDTVNSASLWLKGIDEANNLEDTSFITNPKTSSNWQGKVLNTDNLRYAPVAFNAAMGLFGNKNTPQYNPALMETPSTLKAQQMDVEPARRAAEQGYQTAINSLSGSTGGSGSAMRANLQGLNQGYLDAVSNASLQGQQFNLQNQQGVDQFNLQNQQRVSEGNTNLMNQANLFNLQNKMRDKQTRQDYLGAAAEGLGDIGYEERFGKIMPKIFGYTSKGDYASNLMSKKCGGKLRK